MLEERPFPISLRPSLQSGPLTKERRVFFIDKGHSHAIGLRFLRRQLLELGRIHRDFSPESIVLWRLRDVLARLATIVSGRCR